MSFNRQFLEASPLSTSPPASPWRARAEVLRRRPLRFRQIAFVIASVTFLCSFVFLSRYRADDRRVWISLEDEYPSVVDLGGLAAHGGQRLPPQHQHAHAPALAPQVPVPDTPHQVDTHVKEPPKPPEAVVFSLIMFSEDSAVEGAMLMKVCDRMFLPFQKNIPPTVGASRVTWVDGSMENAPAKRSSVKL